MLIKVGNVIFNKSAMVTAWRGGDENGKVWLIIEFVKGQNLYLSGRAAEDMWGKLNADVEREVITTEGEVAWSNG